MGKRDYLLIFMLALILVTSLTGCTSALITPAAPQQTSTSFIESPDIPAPKPSQTLPSRLEPVGPPNLQPVAGEVPEELLEELIADLVQRTGAARQDIEVVRAEAVVWNDGSLGCPKPGEFYIQILINGYWVVLQVEGVAYDYRVSDLDHFILCEAGGTIIDPVPLMPVAPHGKPPKGGWTQEPQ